MIQKMKIRNALKLIDKMEQLEDLLWQRYYNEFLELLATEDLIEPSNNIKGTSTSSKHRSAELQKSAPDQYNP